MEASIGGLHSKGSGYHNAGGRWTHIKIQYGSGNISIGNYELYGLI
jgi:hypothetical protein